MKLPLSSSIFITAGGTGGHLFPAISTAKALKDKGHKIVFITDQRGHNIEKNLAENTIILPIHRTSNKWGLVLFGFGLVRSLLKCFLYFLKNKPDMVIGFGGYTSLPAVLVAQIMKIPTLIHEQNAVLGRANRLLAKKTPYIGVAFKDVKKLPPNTKIILTGNPIRDFLKPLYESVYTPPQPNDRINIFITGGSQGAKIFSTIIPDAIEKLPIDLQNRINLVMQCRQEYLDETTSKLSKLPILQTIKPFFQDMDKQLEQAHLVICRSGASTLAELSATGRPAILVPYPHAIDNHQYENAKQFEDLNAAWLIEQKNFNADFLNTLLKEILGNTALLEEKSKNIKNLSFINSEVRLAQAIEDLVGKSKS